MAWRTRARRIGLVGLLGSGKTVLLTSLINHLEQHQPQRFRFGAAGGPQVCRFRPCVPGNGWRPRPGWDCFHYRHYREGLVDGAFPPKTGKPLEFQCDFGIHGRRFWQQDHRLQLFDIPGERLADTSIANNAFPEWSDHILWMLGADAKHGSAVQPFLRLLQRADATEAEILAAYKLALARLILDHYKPYITPSSFLLDLDGNLAKPDDGVEKMAQDRCAGMKGAEFAPLSPELRAAQPSLAQRFAQHYRGYQNAVVRPIFRALAGCHALLVLVDVLAILAHGPGMFNDTLNMISDLLDSLRPGNSVGRRLAQAATSVLPAGRRAGGIRKIAFLAPMVDRVAGKADRDNMKTLVRDMLQTKTFNFDGLQCCFESCSAVCSTDVIDEAGRVLSGRPFADDGQPRLLLSYPSSAVPEAWPVDWSPEDFNYPYVCPEMPPIMLHPPRHINLDNIFHFVWT